MSNPEREASMAEQGSGGPPVRTAAVNARQGADWRREAGV